MTVKQFEAVLPLVLAHEGGYVNNAADPGGPTNKGITQKVYDAYRTTKGLTIQSVKLITNDEVADIYKQRYWDLADCNALPKGLDYAVFDYSVNSGVGKAVKDLQRAINSFAGNRLPTLAPLKVDGIAGEDTATAATLASNVDHEALINGLCDRRMAFMKSLKTWKTFGVGWKRRIEGDHDEVVEGDKGVRDYAVFFARSDVGTPVPANDLPTPIGTKTGEAVPGKAFGSQVALMRTVQGAGAALAAAGVTGNTAMDAANTVKGHVNGSILGQGALVLFVLCMVGGIGLVLYKFFEDRKEKAGS